MKSQNNIFLNLDWITILLYLALVMLGWINIYAAVYSDEHQSILDIWSAVWEADDLDHCRDVFCYLCPDR